MNESGPAIASLARKNDVDPDRVIVVHDEIDLAFGALRVKFGGSTAGHNGLRSLERALRTPDFYRVRLGVGRPTGRTEPADWVLDTSPSARSPTSRSSSTTGPTRSARSCATACRPRRTDTIAPRRANPSGARRRSPGKASFAERGLFVLSGRDPGRASGMLEQALDALIGSEAFERLLLQPTRPLERARPLLARADAGEDFLVVGARPIARVAVLVVAPGPREAERLARGRAGVARGGQRRAPAVVGGAAVRGDQPLARGLGAPGGRGPPPAGREGRVRARRARARRDAGTRPHPRRDPAGRAGQGDRAPAGRARRPAGGARLRAHRRRRAPRRVRRARRCARRVPRHRAAAGPPRVLGRRDRVAARVRPVLAAVDRPASPRVEVPPVRELVPDEALAERARARAPRHLDRFRDGLERIAEGLHAEGLESLAPLLFDQMPVPAELLPEGSWVVVSEARRTFDRARRAFRGRERARRGVRLAGPPEAIRDLEDAIDDRVQLQLTGFTEGIDAGLEGWGTAQGNPAELARRAAELAERGYRVLLTARGHGSLERVREFVGLARRRGARGRAAGRFRLPRRQARGRDRGGPVRLAAAHARRAAVHEPAERRDRRGARGRRLRRPPRARRRPVRRRAAARDRRLRTRLHGARVRVGRPALGPHRPGRDGGALRRRGDARGCPGWGRATGRGRPGASSAP